MSILISTLSCRVNNDQGRKKVRALVSNLYFAENDQFFTKYFSLFSFLKNEREGKMKIIWSVM